MAYNKIVSRSVMTAFILKNAKDECLLWYFHFEQKVSNNSGDSFDDTYISKWGEKTPIFLECSLLK